MTKVLITGASGRFARYMAAALRGGYELVLFSRSQPPEDRADLAWVSGDLNSYDDCRRAVAGVGAIMHLGAVPFPSDHPKMIGRALGDRPPLPADATMRTNILGTHNLLRAAVEAGVGTLVMTGSNCAFGHAYRISQNPFPFRYLPLDEAHPPQVEDSYSYSKLAGEMLLASFTSAYGIRTYATRPSGICPPERLQRMAETMAPVRAWSEWLWAYVPSEDLADLQRLIMERGASLPPHSVYVANGLDIAALETGTELITRLRPDLLPIARLNGHQALFSIAKAQAEVGWTPRRSWRDYLPGAARAEP
ncbi:MAG: NAD(P)-dependent oxidoreductase [Chloroflexota bacterium]